MEQRPCTAVPHPFLEVSLGCKNHSCFSFSVLSVLLTWLLTASSGISLSFQIEFLPQIESGTEESGIVMWKIRIAEVSVRSCGREKGFLFCKSLKFPTLTHFLTRFCTLTPTKHQCLMATGDQDDLCAMLWDKGHWLSWLTVSFICDKRLIWDLSLMPFSSGSWLGSFTSLIHFTFLVLSKIP